MSKFTKIDKILSMSYTKHSAKSLYKLMSTYERKAYSEPYQRAMIERMGKIIIACNYFCRALHLKYLRGF